MKASNNSGEQYMRGGGTQTCQTKASDSTTRPRTSKDGTEKMSLNEQQDERQQKKETTTRQAPSALHQKG